MNYRRNGAAGGGERPEDGSSTQEAATEALASPAWPASARSTCPRPGWTLVSSADVPTWQTVQWVLDLRWQAMSWWANGSEASAAIYAATTNLRVALSRRREGAT
jgi:hypothetical protein